VGLPEMFNYDSSVALAPNPPPRPRQALDCRLIPLFARLDRFDDGGLVGVGGVQAAGLSVERGPDISRGRVGGRKIDRLNGAAKGWPDQ